MPVTPNPHDQSLPSNQLLGGLAPIPNGLQGTSGSSPRAYTQLAFGANKVIAYLPIPRSLEFDTSYGWEKEELGQMGNIVDKIGQGQLNSLSAVGTAAASAMGAAVESNSGIYGELYGKYMSGQVANPFSEILFHGVEQREFSMTFDLVGRTQQQMADYMTMLNALYYLAAPDIAHGNTMFKFPDTCNLSIMHGKTSIIRDRVCAIKNIVTNLTPESIYVQFANGAVPHIELTIAFVELKLPTKQTDAHIFGFGAAQSGMIQPDSMDFSDIQSDVTSSMAGVQSSVTSSVTLPQTVAAPLDPSVPKAEPPASDVPKAEPNL